MNYVYDKESTYNNQILIEALECGCFGKISCSECRNNNLSKTKIILFGNSIILFNNKFNKIKNIIYKSENILIDDFIKKLEIFLIKIKKNNTDESISSDIKNLLNKFIEQIKNMNCEIETKLILGYYCNKFNKHHILSNDEYMILKYACINYIENEAVKNGIYKIVIDIHRNMERYNYELKDIGFVITDRRCIDNLFWYEAEKILKK